MISTTYKGSRKRGQNPLNARYEERRKLWGRRGIMDSGRASEQVDPILDYSQIDRLIEKRVLEAVGRATKEVYNRQEACDFLRIGLVTLWDLTKRGLLRPNRATGKPLYLREDLLRFMRENQSLLAEP